jgi:hypothetical protein
MNILLKLFAAEIKAKKNLEVVLFQNNKIFWL